MKQTALRLGAVVLALLISLNLSAATKPTEVLKPYLDTHTCCVVEIDLTRTKPDDVSKWIESVLTGSKVEKAAQAQKTLTSDILPKAQKTVDDLRKAGAHRVYWIASLADMRNDPFFMVIPVEGNANDEKIIKLLPQSSNEKSERVGDAIVSGPAATVERLKNLEPSDQPELTKAFETIGDAPIRAAICVTPDVRMIMQQAPIPQAKEMFDNLDWLAAAVHLPPHPTLRAIGQAQNNDPAEKAASAANELLGMAKDNPELDKFAEFKAQLEGIKPEAKGDQVVLAFDEAKVKAISEAMAPAIIAARQQANMVKSASNERQLLQGMLLYANDNGGAYPDDMDSIIKKYMDGNTDVQINPAATGDDDGYKYIKPPEGTSAGADRLVIYEDFDENAWPEEGINVGYGDGHVEHVMDKDTFEQQLKDAKEKAGQK